MSIVVVGVFLVCVESASDLPCFFSTVFADEPAINDQYRDKSIGVRDQCSPSGRLGQEEGPNEQDDHRDQLY